MSGRRKRYKPTKTDKSVYVNYGLQGKFNVEDLMGDYDTVDVYSLPEAKAENLDERDAARTLDLLVKYRGNVPAPEWHAAVRDRGYDVDPNLGDSLIAYTTDEMVLDSDDEQKVSKGSSDDDIPLSPKVPQRVNWTRYALDSLVDMPSVAFCGTLRIDSDTEIELESLVGKRKSPAAWSSHMEKFFQARYRNIVELSDGYTVAHFQFTERFVALLFNAEGTLLNYFHLNGVIDEI